jgi:hypothetical protein
MWYTKELAVLCEGPSVVRQGPTLLETESDSIFFQLDPLHWESEQKKKKKKLPTISSGTVQKFYLSMFTLVPSGQSGLATESTGFPPWTSSIWAPPLRMSLPLN